MFEFYDRKATSTPATRVSPKSAIISPVWRELNGLLFLLRSEVPQTSDLEYLQWSSLSNFAKTSLRGCVL